RARAGHEGDPRRTGGVAGGTGVELGIRRDRIKERVADETGLDAALQEERLLEGQEAEHKVGAAAEFVDPPAAPGPDLGRDEMDDLDAAALGDLGDREVRARRIDRDEG